MCGLKKNVFFFVTDESIIFLETLQLFLLVTANCTKTELDKTKSRSIRM